MSALGELFVFIIYIFLTLPILFGIGLLILNRNRIKPRHFIILLACSIPLFVFSYNQYSNHRKAELKYVGEYKLTHYPDCETCILKLYKNNHYSVKHNDNELESGKWQYRSGGDYFIVDIGKYGQLGSGKYKHVYPRK